MVEAVGARAGEPGPKESVARLQEAAQEFEALLLAQMLKAMREERGWMGTGEDSTSASMLEIAEEHLARLMAAQGGLGLADLIEQGLGRDKQSGTTR